MKLLRNNCGLSVLEFAILFPVFLLILLGTIEVGRYALIQQKLDKTTNAMADYVTQSSAVRYTDMDSFAQAARQIMKPFDFSGTIIFTAAVYRNINVPPCQNAPESCITWQYAPVGGSPSRVGTPGTAPQLPGGYTVTLGEVIIIAETYYSYEPLFPITGSLVSALADHAIYKIAVYKPRQVGALVNPPT